MKVNKWLLPALALALLLGTVGVAQAMGVWQVSGKEMVNVENLTGGADIKGWMTLQQVADGAGITVETLYSRLSLPAEMSPSTALKDMEGVIEGFEVTTVREVVDEVMGIAPATDSEAAVESAKETHETEAAPQPTATPEPAPTVAPTPMATAPAEHTPQGDGSGADDGDGGVPPAVTGALDIKGRHTLQEIVDATGIKLDELLAALKLPPETDPHMAMRDLVEAGLIGEIDEVRAAVADLQP